MAIFREIAQPFKSMAAVLTYSFPLFHSVRQKPNWVVRPVRGAEVQRVQVLNEMFHVHQRALVECGANAHGYITAEEPSATLYELAVGNSPSSRNTQTEQYVCFYNILTTILNLNLMFRVLYNCVAIAVPFTIYQILLI